MRQLTMQDKKNKVLRIYEQPSGKAPFSDWLAHLKDRAVRARIRTRLDRVEKGNYGDHKILGDGVFELRFHFGPGYRIYCAELGDIVVILLSGGDKGDQSKSIDKAKQYWRDMQEKLNE
jgi:putative addiction module killer protein